MFKNKIKIKKIIFVLACLVLLLFPTAFSSAETPPQEKTWAQATVETIALPFLVLIGYVCEIVSWVLGLFLWLIGGIFDSIVSGTTINSEAMNNVITGGWVIVRDVLNIIFVLALLGIAFATILRIESYHFKALLPKLLLAALLVNFSKTIALTLIDFSNAIMSGIMGTQGGLTSTGAIAALLNLDSLYQISDQINLNEGDFRVAATNIAIVIFLGMIMMALAGLCVLLVIRTVVLMILTVFAPVAFVLNVLPVTQKYASRWWEEFVKYLFVGPVVCICYLLALFFAAQSAHFGNMVPTMTTEFKQANIGVSGMTVGPLFGFLMACGIMFVGFTFTKEAAAGMAGAVMSGVKKGLLATSGFLGKKAAGGLSASLRKGEQGTIGRLMSRAGRPGQWMAKKLPYLSPGAWVEGYKKYRGEMAGEEAVGVGRVGDTIGRALTLGRRRLTLADQAEDSEISRRIKAEDIETSPREQEAAMRAVRTGDVRGWDATITAAAKKGERNLNDVTCAVFEQFRPQMERAGVIAVGEEASFTPKILRFMHRNMHGAGRDRATRNRGARIFANVADSAFGSGVYSMAGEVSYADGEFSYTVDDSTLETNAGKNAAIIDKIDKIDPQLFLREIHGNTFRGESFGAHVNAYEAGDIVASHLKRDHINSISMGRCAPEALKAIVSPTRAREDLELAVDSTAIEAIQVRRAGATIRIAAGARLQRGDVVIGGQTARIQGVDYGLAHARSINSAASRTAITAEITRLRRALGTATTAQQRAELNAQISLQQRELDTVAERAATEAALYIEAGRRIGTYNINDPATGIAGRVTTGATPGYDFEARSLEEKINAARQVIS